MNATSIRKSLLWVFIGFLTITAVLAIVAVLSGEFGDFQVKTLVTTFSISVASICSMACAAYMERRKNKPLGFSGIGISVAAAAVVIAGIWLEMEEDEYWKTAGSLVVFAIGSAHALLLLIPKLPARYQWTQVASTVSIVILGLQIAAAIWGEIDDEGYYRILAAVSIVVVLFTLLIPILMRMGKKDPVLPSSKLVLEAQDDGTYVDESGTAYRVTEIADSNGTAGE